VSETNTLLGQQGSRTAIGDLQMVPVAGSAVWIAPLYVESETAGQPLLRRMIVNYDGKVGIDTTIGRALAQVLPGFRADVGDVAGATPTDPGVDPPTSDETPQELLAQAQQLFDEADDALTSGDLGTYAEKVEAARELVARALELLAD
jgi:uncharacterized membrane protein (UPF0182 family)